MGKKELTVVGIYFIALVILKLIFFNSGLFNFVGALITGILMILFPGFISRGIFHLSSRGITFEKFFGKWFAERFIFFAGVALVIFSLFFT